ncbi:hypothetical protein M427DRAFT_50846 [Gonapodya prolifera JEL478]|uniref:SH3 domain-containing protein n=1 Tax=Gonapodya prolifera (strain JEL478) TaxID=1344416 RepID=A0A139B0Q5_GONPJ|nr:hypothetical protein M427DRAFT_50846 [Gonapodya prolifera JEL478]|eukprot:KXS22547.1 hypothetical protein M427DRAFT_50846 [Gonapodya prolifera JEL478]
MVGIIDAIESGNLEEVRRAIGESSPRPNARKRISLECKVLVSRNLIGKPEERVETDTADGESALCLAILTGRSELVRAVLEAGADPNSMISWKVPSGAETWTKALWEKRRWHLQFTSPSALDFALGGVRVFFGDGSPAIRQQAELEDTGRLLISKRGENVRLSNPRSPSESYQRATLTPNLDIVTWLLNKGAVVSLSCRDAATRLGRAASPLPEFAALLEAPRSFVIDLHRGFSVTRGDEMRTPSQSSRVTIDDTRRGSAVDDLRRELEDLRRTVEAQIGMPPPGAIDIERERDALYSQLMALQHQHEQLLCDHDQLTELYRDLRRENEYIRKLYVSSEPPNPQSPLPIFKLVVVKSDYEKEGPEYMNLLVGQRVFCYAEYVNTWGWGTNDSSRENGFFPLSCVMAPPHALDYVAPDELLPTISLIRNDIHPPSLPLPVSGPVSSRTPSSVRQAVPAANDTRNRHMGALATIAPALEDQLEMLRVGDSVSL